MMDRRSFVKWHLGAMAGLSLDFTNVVDVQEPAQGAIGTVGHVDAGMSSPNDSKVSPVEQNAEAVQSPTQQEQHWVIIVN